MPNPMLITVDKVSSDTNLTNREKCPPMRSHVFLSYLYVNKQTKQNVILFDNCFCKETRVIRRGSKHKAKSDCELVDALQTELRKVPAIKKMSRWRQRILAIIGVMSGLST